MLASSYGVPVSTFLASTFAPATTAPAGSAMVPVMVPRSLCANAATQNTNKQARPVTVRMKTPLFSFSPNAAVRMRAGRTVGKMLYPALDHVNGVRRDEGVPRGTGGPLHL